MGEEEEELRQVAQLKPRGVVGKQHRAGAGWAGGRGLGGGEEGRGRQWGRCRENAGEGCCLCLPQEAVTEGPGWNPDEAVASPKVALTGG